MIHLGCGLDNQGVPVEPGPDVQWYDVDYPDVLDLRKKVSPAGRTTTWWPPRHRPVPAGRDPADGPPCCWPRASRTPDRRTARTAPASSSTGSRPASSRSTSTTGSPCVPEDPAAAAPVRLNAVLGRQQPRGCPEECQRIRLLDAVVLRTRRPFQRTLRRVPGGRPSDPADPAAALYHAAVPPVHIRALQLTRPAAAGLGVLLGDLAQQRLIR